MKITIKFLTKNGFISRPGMFGQLYDGFGVIMWHEGKSWAIKSNHTMNCRIEDVEILHINRIDELFDAIRKLTINKVWMDIKSKM